MLSHQILTRQDIGDVANYYGDAADDYYAKEGEAQVWQGKGAEALGLAGEVNRERFRDLLAGRVDPDGPSVRVGNRDDAKTRIGIDLTFSAPKSVSIMALVGGDKAIIAAHDRAVARAIEEAERRAQARIKTNGRSRVETTGNLVVAKFRHETTRAQDPELHTHAVVMNLTQRSDGQWRALKNDEIVQSTRFLGDVYTSELARELQLLGHTLTFGRDGNFELSNISRDQVLGFSRRSAQIEEWLAERGLTRETATSAQLQAATMQTRDRKDPELDRDALYNEWRDRAHALGIELGARPDREHDAESASSRAGDPANVADQDTAAHAAVQYAVNHLIERDAALNQSEVVSIALKHTIGRTTLPSITHAIDQRVADGQLIREETLYKVAGHLRGEALTAAEWTRAVSDVGLSADAALARVQTAIDNGGLVPQEPRFTTPEAVARETRVLAIEKAGRGAVAPILSNDEARAYFASRPLNEGQAKAATLILSTPDRVVGIEGLAGTGKSHLLDQVKERINATHNPTLGVVGYDFRALAPYGTQVKALRELGVQANTVASFLKAKDKNISDRTVLVIDEAGTVPARQMADLLAIAEKAGARVVLVGDRAQTKAIEAGRPFDQLIRAGMQTTSLTEIQRQKNPVLKEAVELAARGQAKQSLAKIEHVVEIADDRERRRAVAAAYVELPAHERNKTIIVSGTNEARREINAYVRDQLGLAGRGADYSLLIRRDTTQEERRHAQNYRIGDAIQPDQTYSNGLTRGELYTVVGTTSNGIHLEVQSADGSTISFNPAKASLSVYEVRRDELSVGDLVKVTHNDKRLDLANGERFRVTSIAHDRVVLEDGKRRVTLPADRPMHVDHAYVTTAHSSQGLTEDRTIADVDTRSKTTKRDTWYVKISRARFETRVFTNSIEKLSPAISRPSIKNAALDIHRGQMREHVRAGAAAALNRQQSRQKPTREKTSDPFDRSR